MLAEAMEVIGQSASLQTCKLNAFNALLVQIQWYIDAKLCIATKYIGPEDIMMFYCPYQNKIITVEKTTRFNTHVKLNQMD